MLILFSGMNILRYQYRIAGRDDTEIWQILLMYCCSCTALCILPMMCCKFANIVFEADRLNTISPRYLVRDQSPMMQHNGHFQQQMMMNNGQQQQQMYVNNDQMPMQQQQLMYGGQPNFNNNGGAPPNYNMNGGGMVAMVPVVATAVMERDPVQYQMKNDGQQHQQQYPQTGGYAPLPASSAPPAAAYQSTFSNSASNRVAPAPL